jgi:hypothetical protein
MRDLSKREIGVAISIALLVLASSSSSYTLGYGRVPERLESDGFAVDLENGRSHVAPVERGTDGDREYLVPFTPEDHPRVHPHTFCFTLDGLLPLGFWLTDGLTFFTIPTFPSSAVAVTPPFLFLALACTQSEAPRLRTLILRIASLRCPCTVRPSTALFVDGILAGDSLRENTSLPDTILACCRTTRSVAARGGTCSW